MKPLPELTQENTAFWTGGQRGELMIAFCDDCRAGIHPPQLICPKCLSQNVGPQAVAGTGVVHSYTVNYQAWVPDMEVPFAIAVVDVDGAPGVRVTAPVAGCAAEDVHIDQCVKIDFEPTAEIWLPLWRAAEKGGAK